MAESFSIPLATHLLGALDTTIAKGPDYSWVANLPDAYWAGQNQAYKSRQQDLFAGGNLPRDAAGNVDWNRASQMALEAGGAAAIPEAIAVGNLQGGQAILQRNRELDGGGYTPPIQGSTGSPSSATATSAPEAQGTSTLRQIAKARDFDLGAFMQATGVTNPDVPLNYDQRQRAVAQVQGAPAVQSDVQEADSVVPNTRVASAFGSLPQPAGTGALSGVIPVQTVPIRQAQAQAPAQAAPVSSVPGTRPPALPAQVQQMEQRAQQLENLARQKSDLAVAAGQFGRVNEQKALTDEADRLGKAALSVRDSMQRMMEPTPEEKNANNPAVLAFERAKKLQELNLARADKQFSGLEAQSTQYERDLKPYTDLGTSVLSDPSTYTGIGANAVLDINKVRAAFGAPKAAMMAEAVQKLNAASVLSQINTQKDQMQEAGSNSSRIFSSQIDQVEKASANMGNTIFGNRFLLNVQQHMGETASDIARQARAYRKQHGTLDDNFDEQVSNYLQRHPVFSDLERARPDVLGAPTLPPGASKWSPQEYVAWGKTLGLRSGDTVRIGTGRYGTIPKLPGT